RVRADRRGYRFYRSCFRQASYSSYNDGAAALGCPAVIPQTSGSQPCSRGAIAFIELAGLSLRPLIQLGNIHQNLAIRRQFYMSSVHGTWRRAFEVHPFAVVTAAVAWTLELVFRRLPIWRATQVCTPGVDHEEAIRSAIHPNAVFLLELGIYAKPVIGRITNLEAGSRLE